MSIFILSDPKNRDGPHTWKNLFIRILEQLNKKYNLIEKDDITNINFGLSNIIILNNYSSSSFFNRGTISSISKFNKIYLVVHSPLSPSNGVILNFNSHIYGFICISKQIYDKVKTIYPNKKAYLMQNYVITAPIDRNVINNKISFVGRLSPEKNLPLLFYAIKNISDTNKDLKFSVDIFGNATDPDYEGYLKDIVDDLKINNIICFKGKTSDHAELFGKCQYVILPSISEGSSYSILEALSYNIPVIASNVGNANEIIKDNGLVFSFEGSKNYNKTLYIGNYDDLLEEIGYIEGIVKYPNSKFRHFKRQLIPPMFFEINETKNKVSLFNKNVDILKNAIIIALNNKIIFKPVETNYEKEYINNVSLFIEENIIDEEYILTRNNLLYFNGCGKMKYCEEIKKFGKICSNLNEYYSSSNIELLEYELISVIIPIYNRRNKIKATLQSLFLQTYPNLEMIIIDDASNDRLMDDMQNYSKIKYVRLDENMGCWNARNIGLSIAAGNYIIFHDSDDISEKNRILMQYKIMKYYNLKLIGTMMIRTHINIFNENHINDVSNVISRIDSDKNNKNIKHHLQCCKKFLGFPTLLYKRELFSELGDFTKMIKGTDADWLSRFFNKYENINISNGYKLHEYISNNPIGKNYYFLNDVTYYSSEMDEFNISNLRT